MLEDALAEQEADPTSVITSLHHRDNTAAISNNSSGSNSISNSSGNGITMTKWISDLDLLVCSSECGAVSLVDMRKRAAVRAFTGHKKHTYIQTREAIYRDTYTTSSGSHGSRKPPRIVMSTESDSRVGATRTTSVQTFDWWVGLTLLVHMGLPHLTYTSHSNLTHFYFHHSSLRSGEGKYIVSGGERELLVWDPYTLQIVAPLRGLSSAVVGVQVGDDPWNT